MNHNAIYNTHLTVKSITDNEDGSVTAYDQDNNEVILDGSEVVEDTRLQAEYDNAQYARDRVVAYPPMADQLDDIFHNGVAGWKKTIQAVKDTYPKP